MHCAKQYFIIRGIIRENEAVMMSNLLRKNRLRNEELDITKPIAAAMEADFHKLSRY
jgi:hypothetical protein